MRKIALLTALVTASAVSQASALDKVNTKRFVDSVTAAQIFFHLFHLQRIATRNDDNRALGTSGYSASVRYVVDRMKKARYNVIVQPFIANLFEENTPAEFERTGPTVRDYVLDTDFTTMQYSGSRLATDPPVQLALADGIVMPPDPTTSTSASGCDPGDFPGASGKIVLIQRGACTFEQKAQNAAAAGAEGVIIFNEGNPGRTDLLDGTLTNEQPIAVVGTTFAVGEELYNLAVGPPAQVVTVDLAVDATTTPVQSWNVLAEKKGKVTNQDVVVGAHLDSVPEGPGMNDNGSGTATLLTIAEQMTWQHIKPRNTVRFAFWGAEEAGLFGSTYYVDNLTEEQFANISLNLNFDMMGSPNFVRFVLDGDGSAGGDPGPAGSEVIENVFTDYFTRRGLASDPTPLDGSTDYFPFINNGIPAGGLFSGADELKTPEQAAVYGGTAGVAYDVCYHQACDTAGHLSFRSISQLGKAAAHAVLYFAQTKENVRPAAAAAITAAKTAATTAEYRGPYLVR